MQIGTIVLLLIITNFEPPKSNKFKMLQVLVNKETKFEIENKDNIFTINGVSYKPDISKVSESEYHMILNYKSYRLVIAEQLNDKELVIEVNGTRYPISLKDNFDILLEKLGMNSSANQLAKDVKAPMPGLVVDVLVTPGQEVEKDTPLLILEAMKMENILKSPGAGIIDKIFVHKKDAVEKNQVLIAFK